VGVGPEDPLEVVRRWTSSGGVVRLVSATSERLDVELLTCDAGEVMGRVTSEPPDPALVDLVSREGS
jgi:hypothetical protein